MLHDLWNWLTLKSVGPELAREQFRLVSRQIPLLYALICVNSLCLAYAYHGVAPAWIALWVPAILFTGTFLRMCFWLFKPPRAKNGRQAIRQLKRITVIGIAFGVFYVSWALALNLYGDDIARAHVAIFISVTVGGCIFCLLYHPQAALAITVIVTVPYVVFYATQGNFAFQAIAINMLLVTIVLIRALHSSFEGFSELIHSRSEKMRLHREMVSIAHTDPLTKLANRRLFFAEADRRIAESRKTGECLAMGVIDLDGFKVANDTYGHLVGDRLLEAASGRLRAIFDTGCMVARIGGDEFAFIGPMSAEKAAQCCNHACNALREPFRTDDLVVTVGASGGVAATSDVDVSSASMLYDKADYALYTAKADHRGNCVVYAAAHEERNRAEQAIEKALLTADFEREMEVHFQPIVRVSDEEIIGAEALARWTSPTLGAVRPDLFVALAERAGMMQRLTTILFEKTLADFQSIPAPLRVSFNLSAHDVISSPTILAIVSIVRRSAIDPRRITFELTETAVLRDFDAAERSLLLLKKLGAQIAIDDFGTGYSSMQYLDRLPIDRVKIDRVFLDGSDNRGQGCGRLLTALIALCHSLNLQCVAEGVETEEQRRFLQTIGCDLYQGYHFARPMTAAALNRMLSTENPGRRVS